MSVVPALPRATNNEQCTNMSHVIIRSIAIPLTPFLLPTITSLAYVTIYSRTCTMERIKKELKLSFFSRQDANEKTIDIKATFSPSPKAITFTAKLFIIATIIWNLTQTFDSFDDDTHVWIYFLTKWGFTLGMVYVVFSTITTFNPSEKLVNITWALFATVLPVQLFVTLNYWVLVYGGGKVPFYSIYEVRIYISKSISNDCIHIVFKFL